MVFPPLHLFPIKSAFTAPPLSPTPRSMRLSRFLRFFVIPFLFIFGCSKENVQKPATSEPVLVQQYRQGSTLVVVSLSETNIPTSGSLQFTLEIHAPPPNKIIFPELEGLVEPFTISGGYTEPPLTLPTGKQRHRRVWTLIPALPGETVFQAMEIAGAASITTEPIAVSVSSLLPRGLETFEIKDIAAPATLLPEQRTLRRSGLILAGSAIAIALAIAFIRLQRKTKPLAWIPPHETAFHALETLPEDPIARLHELNRILCEYIEYRFTLPMIGKTTSEILPILENTKIKGLTPTLVGLFEHGEQVRFSNRVPEGFVEEAERIAREFVEATKWEEPCG